MARPDRTDPDDPLRILSERLDRASEATERLLADAAAHVAADAAGGAAAGGGERGGARKPPPAGWHQAPPAGGEDHGGRSRALLGSEADLLLHLLGSVRDRIPPDLQRRLTEAVRELLLALRAFIDWYLERSERQGAGPLEVRDIPIL